MLKQILWLKVILLGAALNANAVVYYSRTSGGNWTDPAAWSTVTYGDPTNSSGTFPKAGDVVYIGNGYTININAACVTTQLFVGQGASGILQFSAAANYSLTIQNNVTINAGATIRYTGNSSRTHTMFVGTNLTNSGTLDLFADADDVVNLTFNRASNSVVSGTGVTDLNNVTIQKQTSTTFFVDMQSTTFEAGIRNLVLTYGTYIHNNSAAYVVNSASSSAFTIPADAVFRVTNGSVQLSSNNADCFLNGTINVTGGTLTIGNAAGTGGLRYEKPGTFNPNLNIQGGSVVIRGALTFKTGAATSPLVFIMSGGTLLLNSGTTGAATSVFHVNDVTGSSVTMTDGTITLQKPNTTGTTVADAVMCGTSGSVSVNGGTMIFGNSSTTSGSVFTFNPLTNLNWPNMQVAGPAAAAVTLCPVSGNANNINALSLDINPNKTFDVLSADGVSGGSRMLKLTSNFDGINSLFCDGNFICRNSEILLQGGEGQQINGTGSLSLTNLTINNLSGASLAVPVTLSGLLRLTAGVLFTSTTALLTLTETASVTGASASDYIDGPLKVTVASAGAGLVNFPIGSTGNYRPVTLTINHSSAALAYYQAEVTTDNPRIMGYGLPATIDRISGVRYVSMSRTGAANLSSVSITMNYGTDDGVDDPSSLRLAQYDGGASWSDIGGTGSGIGSGDITSNTLTSLGSFFALANSQGGSNPLPVQWLNFAAKRVTASVLLTWATASEINSDYFEVQRSENGTLFSVIGTVKAAGEANSVSLYKFLDTKPLNTGKPIYYRLKQVDRDGQFSLSKICVVQDSRAEQVMLYPMPAQNAIQNIVIPESWELPVNITCHDYAGRLIYEGTIENRTSSFPAPVLNSGVSKALVRFSDMSGHSYTAQWQN